MNELIWLIINLPPILIKIRHNRLKKRYFGAKLALRYFLI